jgi:hypothetical protein
VAATAAASATAPCAGVGQAYEGIIEAAHHGEPRHQTVNVGTRAQFAGHGRSALQASYQGIEGVVAIVAAILVHRHAQKYRIFVSFDNHTTVIYSVDDSKSNWLEISMATQFSEDTTDSASGQIETFFV